MISHHREHSPTHGENSYFNNISILGDCVGEMLSVEILIRFLSCKLVKLVCLGCKAPLWYFLAEEWELGSIRGSKVCKMTARVVRLERTMSLNSVGDRSRKCDRERRE